MHRHALALIALTGLLAGCGGPSDKAQASKVAVAYRRASNENDFINEWKLRKADAKGYRLGYLSPEGYAEAKRQNPAGPPVIGLRYAVELAQKEGAFYRVRVQVTDPRGGDNSLSDVIVGKYGGHWLVAGSVEPGYPITAEDVQ